MRIVLCFWLVVQSCSGSSALTGMAYVTLRNVESLSVTSTPCLRLLRDGTVLSMVPGVVEQRFALDLAGPAGGIVVISSDVPAGSGGVNVVLVLHGEEDRDQGWQVGDYAATLLWSHGRTSWEEDALDSHMLMWAFGGGLGLVIGTVGLLGYARSMARRLSGRWERMEI